MQKKKRKNRILGSYRGKLVLTIASLAVFIVLAISVISFQLANRKIEEMARLQSANNVSFAESSLNSYYKDMESLTTQLLRLPLVQELAVPSTRVDPGMHNILYSQLMNTASQSGEGGTRFSTIGLFMANGDQYIISYNTRFDFTSYEECIESLYSKGERTEEYAPPFFCIVTVIDELTGKSRKSLAYVRYLYERFTLKKLGILVSEISNNAIFEKIGFVSDSCIIVSPDGEIMAAHDPELIGSRFENEKMMELLLGSGNIVETISKDSGLTSQAQVLSYCSVLGNAGYLIAPFDYYSEMNQADVAGYLQSVLIMVVVSLLATAVLAVLLSGKLSASVQSLTSFVKQAYAGSFSGRYVPEGEDEIAYLGEKINDMLDRIEESARERELDLKNQQIMELRLMQSQINPHLLYNTLDSVLWAIQNGNTENATELIASLSGFFRIALSRGVERIPLGKEIQLIDNYVNIQRLARGQNVTLIKEIPEELLDYSIIKLTLQPFVENAYLHGFSGYRDDGTIILRASYDESFLTIEVEDNGIGMLPEEVDEVNSYLNANLPSEKSASVGLYNVNRRIVHEYGKEYGVRVRSEISEYTVVTVTLPYTEK
ncbi:MAG: sensor histidine kinase [Lachnospiraceae bacterium]|nr:sensor histidine kinase [Lachnospiraceae bacterium]